MLLVLNFGAVNGMQALKSTLQTRASSPIETWVSGTPEMNQRHLLKALKARSIPKLTYFTYLLGCPWYLVDGL